MNVADDVERPMVEGSIGPERLALDRGGFDLVDRRQSEDVAESFTPQTSERLPEIAGLAADHVCAEVSVGSTTIPFLAERLGQVEHDRDWHGVIAACQLDQRLSGHRLHVGRIDHG